MEGVPLPLLLDDGQPNLGIISLHRIFANVLAFSGPIGKAAGHLLN